MAGRLFKFYRHHADSSVKHIFWLTVTVSQPPTTPPLILRKALLPRQIASTNLPTPKGWIAWLARAQVNVHNLLQSHYTIKFNGSSRNWTQIDGPKIALDANEPTMLYITGRDFNLRKLPGRQWSWTHTFQTAATDNVKGWCLYRNSHGVTVSISMHDLKYICIPLL